MRPIWKGALSFGLVYVPVKIYAATEQKDIKFNYLHEKCKSPVQYRRYCPYCQVEVPMEEIVRGYEYEKGKYVVINEDDFEKLAGAKSGRSVEIMDFVNLEEIDPVYYEKAYYLAPGDGGAKVYELFRRAMADTGKVAVARVVIRNREALAAIRVSKNILAMSTMHYPDEIRQADVLPEFNYQVDLHENEVKMAVNLINSLSAEFRPEKYNDKYRQALMEVIQARIAGEAVAVPEKAETGKVVDLMEALKASIELAREERDKKGKSQKKDRPEKTAAKRKTS
ncbi:Ku protein [Pelotomaculum terephthalicicum JT]|uniref:non-homologous end joining protein Ku n=1 Tax=Pelotomaculum terephthalicicum TaxID=206393 RepID=UPI001F03EF2B|nr:Ku protein [Pelotomaculum terephthalicicum]MCG9967798.1 Ku protein [Pelotomaculum terephthalicicum JT]